MMVVGGTGLAQANSAPQETGSRWRRHTALVAVAAAAVAAALSATRPGTYTLVDAAGTLLMLLLVLGQWWTAYRGQWAMQRWLGIVVFLLFILPVAGVELAAVTAYPGRHSGIAAAAGLAGVAGAALACGVVGGSLAACLLVGPFGDGASAPSQRALRRLLMMVIVMLLLRFILSATMALWPWWDQWGIDSSAPHAAGPPRNLWTAAMLLGRYAVGGLLPLPLTALAFRAAGRGGRRWVCGLLWLATAALVIGEACALELARATARPF
jgi:hypothetical protein